MVRCCFLGLTLLPGLPLMVQHLWCDCSLWVVLEPLTDCSPLGVSSFYRRSPGVVLFYLTPLVVSIGIGQVSSGFVLLSCLWVVGQSSVSPVSSGPDAFMAVLGSGQSVQFLKGALV